MMHLGRLTLALIALAACGIAPQAARGGPIVANLSITASQLARYERFEAQFDLTTVAANPDLPFDPAPPPGVRPGSGVSVDGLFSRDSWTTTIIQPAFLYQPYTQTTRDNQDHFTPNGRARWTVRFAPQQEGTWQYRLRVTDASGTSFYPPSGALTFVVSGTSSSPYRWHGFLQVSPNDPRYFEFQDGTPFIGVGFNDGFGSAAERRAEDAALRTVQDEFYAGVVEQRRHQRLAMDILDLASSRI